MVWGGMWEGSGDVSHPERQERKTGGEVTKTSRGEL